MSERKCHRMVGSHKQGRYSSKRPGDGRDPFLGFKCPADLQAMIDEWAGRWDCTRSEAIRRLLERGLSR
jgi:hypothetical protein